MMHYNLDEWKLYINDLIDENERIDMENHLFKCDECLEIYLNAVNESDLVKEVLNQDFTNDVIKTIRNEKALNKKENRSTLNVFMYYTAAAAVTLFLMSQGFFTAITREVPKTTANIMNTSKYVESISGSSWTEELVQKTMNIFKKQH